MKKQLFLGIGLIAAIAGLAAMTWILLPDVVNTQLFISVRNQSQMAKPLAILVPGVLGVAFAVLGILTRSKRYIAYFTICSISLVLFILLLIINQ